MGNIYEAREKIPRAREYREKSLKMSYELYVVFERDLFLMCYFEKTFQDYPWSTHLINIRTLTLECALEHRYGKDASHPKIVTQLQAIGNLCRKEGDMIGARKNLKKAIKIHRGLGHTDSNPEMATLIHNLGM